MSWLGVVAGVACLASLSSCGGGSNEPDVAELGPTPPEDVRLYLAGLGEIYVVDVASERSRRVEFPALAAGDPQNFIEARGNGFVSWSGSRTTYSSFDLGEAPRSIGKSLYFVAGADDDGVWLIGKPRKRDGRRLGSVSEVDTRGLTIVPSAHPPPGYVSSAVNEGLVFGSGGRLDVWDPVADEVVERIPTVGGLPGAAHGDQISLCDYERGSSLRIADAATGARTPLDTPANVAAVDCGAGEFSPDGRLLAVPVWISKQPLVGFRSYERAPEMLGIADMRTGRLTVIPGTRVPNEYDFARWSPTGESAFILGWENDGARKNLVVSRIVEHEIASGATHAIDVRVGSFYDVAVAEAAGPLPMG